MGGFTKLFSRILTSSIWSESNEVRIVWITLLAATGPDGIARCTLPGLARLAHLDLPETEKAVAVLSSPDKYSRTVEHEGRRIREERAEDGSLIGWFVYNYSKHRAVDATAAERQRRRRKAVTRDRHARQKTEDRSTEEQKTEGRTDPATPVAALVLKAKTWSQEACEDWSEFSGGVAPGGKIGSALKPLIAKVAREHGTDETEAWSKVRPYWRKFCESDERKYGPHAFAENPRRVVETGPKSGFAMLAEKLS